jgi:hypothetical protein
MRASEQVYVDVDRGMLPVMAAIIREFFIDFLSSLVPGFLFTIFVIPLVIVTGTVVFQGEFAWSAIGAAADHYHPELWCLTLVLSYVLGSVFSRRDPKIPDRKSATYILWKDWASISRAVIQPRGEKLEVREENFFFRFLARLVPSFGRWRMAMHLAEGDGAQFPYSHLFEYLSDRGLDHLAVRVPWHGNDPKINERSKMFINILKVRLQFANQKQCGDIVRNEAHIRMMSSVWYAALELEQVCVVLLLSLVMSYLFHHPKGAGGFGTLLVLLTLLLIAAEWLRLTIVRFLHYQRVREIVYVLETAHTAFRAGQKDIFEGLEYSGPSRKVGKRDSEEAMSFASLPGDAD